MHRQNVKIFILTITTVKIMHAHKVLAMATITLFQTVHQQRQLLLYPLLAWSLTTTYVSLEFHGRATNIYGFWNCSQFPGLEAAARKFPSAPLTGVASEQLFSAAGQIYSDCRSSLLRENAEKLLFLAYSIRLFDYQY